MVLYKKTFSTLVWKIHITTTQHITAAVT